MEQNLVCNICQNTEFVSFGIVPRSNARCIKCKSLERHRAVYAVIQNLKIDKDSNFLHFAPEKTLYDLLITKIDKRNYIVVDKNTERYSGLNCIKLNLPEDFKKINENTYDYILHDHVLEHIPGSFKEHIKEFHRIMKQGGKMIFTIPYDMNKQITEEGGEFLTDRERLKKFKQHDHFKFFGMDILDEIKNTFMNVELLFDPKHKTEYMLKHNAIGIVFVVTK